MLGLILYHHIFVKYGHNVLRSAIFNSFSRLFWSLAVCSIIFNCTTGHGGIVNRFLSQPVFTVGAKLTYSMYLTHEAVIQFFTQDQRQSGYFSNLQIFVEFCGYFAAIVMSSVVLYLVFEAPVVALMKNLQNDKKTKKY
ncbi:unnamed protein product [Tenebrio molitor]|nr:unnamed protein product [Tenebrio molitor]